MQRWSKWADIHNSGFPPGHLRKDNTHVVISVSLRVVNLTLVGLVGYYNCMEYLSCVLSRCVEGFRISPFANIVCDQEGNARCDRRSSL